MCLSSVWWSRGRVPDCLNCDWRAIQPGGNCHGSDEYASVDYCCSCADAGAGVADDRCDVAATFCDFVFFFWVNLKNVKLFNLIFLCFCHITTAKLHLLLKTKRT